MRLQVLPLIVIGYQTSASAADAASGLVSAEPCGRRPRERKGAADLDEEEAAREAGLLPETEGGAEAAGAPAVYQRQTTGEKAFLFFWIDAFYCCTAVGWVFSCAVLFGFM